MAREFTFTVYLKGIQVFKDEDTEALFAEGCNDATPVSRDGQAFLDFTREADSHDAAVCSAIIDIKRAGFEVARVKSSAQAVAEFRADYESWASGLGKVGASVRRGARFGKRHDIGVLMRRIKLMWRDMDEDFQTRVQEHFRVREVEGDVLVNL
jgi:hypothetical protein